jgi:hypothetical protein
MPETLVHLYTGAQAPDGLESPDIFLAPGVPSGCRRFGMRGVGPSASLLPRLAGALIVRTLTEGAGDAITSRDTQRTGCDRPATSAVRIPRTSRRLVVGRSAVTVGV